MLNAAKHATFSYFSGKLLTGSNHEIKISFISIFHFYYLLNMINAAKNALLHYSNLWAVHRIQQRISFISFLLFWRTWWIRQNILSHIFLGSCSLHPITNFELRFFLTFLIWLTCWMRQNTLSLIFLGSCSLDPITNHEFLISFLQIFYSEPSNEIIAIWWTCWMRQNMLSHILFL